MKALIVYGTGRGTTGRIADAIVEGLNSGGMEASSISLEYVTSARIQSAELFGVGTPVHFYREARYVASFLSSLPRLDGKRTFVFCACGMDRPGETLHRLHLALEEKGAVVVGAESFRSAMSYYPHRKRGLGNPDSLPDDSVLEGAHSFGLRMARFEEHRPVQTNSLPIMTSLKARVLANMKFRRMIFPGVRLEPSMCTGYGSCLSRCLVNGLDRKDGETIPFFTESCVHCLECIAWCPRGAIQVDSPVKEWISTLSYRLGIH